MSSIYKSEEDSYLMASVLKEKILNLKNNSKLKVIEIGCGSGVNLNALLEAGIKKENILGSDINPKAVAHCKKLGFNCLVSDLFENIKEKFDLIIFNPPYLPTDKREAKDSQLATTGGKRGNELSKRFLQQAKSHLSDKGKIFLITSSLSKPTDFHKLGYMARVLAEKKLFFEQLLLWELSLKI